MTEDARFEDGDERPLRLKAITFDDVPIMSALLQDAVFPATEMVWDRKGRRFAILLNRIRWEHRISGTEDAIERVQSVLVIEDVLGVQSQGVSAGDEDAIHALLSIEFAAGESPAGRVLLTFSGDGTLALEVEALEITIRDVTRPYLAPSGKTPDHGA